MELTRRLAAALFIAATVVTSLLVPEDCVGAWEVPAHHVTALLYTSELNARRSNQRVVDRANCALWWPYGRGHAVIDHAFSEAGAGLWCVEDFRIGDVATLTTGKGTEYYVCTGILLCRRRKRDYAFRDRAFAPGKGDVICLSCADEEGLVYAAYFERIE